MNKIIDITPYSLAGFVNKYLLTNRPELAQKELDTSEIIEQSIMARSRVYENRKIDPESGIYLKTAQKWLNCLRYKWRKV